MERPKKYKAKDLQGNWITGWYVEIHIPRFDNDIPDRVVGYDIVPSLFNDEKGERNKGSYWHTIDPSTLREINEPEQLNYFNQAKESNKGRLSLRTRATATYEVVSKESDTTFNSFLSN